MAAITQRVSNYLGGVSKQSDDKKLPNQVRECLNGYPDPTFGLTKRPGFKWIANLGTGTTYDNAKWFYIHRDNDEKYIGCIKPALGGSTGDIDIWNGTSGAACTVNYGTGAQAYLTGARTNYDVLTVQDTSIITNNLFTVTTIAAPSFIAKSEATLVLSDTPVGKFNVTISDSDGSNSGSITEYDSPTTQTYDGLLAELKTRIDGLSITGLTVTKYSTSLELKRTVSSTDTAFKITCSGGSANSKLNVLQDQVDNVSQLPFQSKNGRVVKIINTAVAADTYFAKFVAEDGTSGRGYWEETIDPTKSTGLTDTTMPHELVNTDTDEFEFRKIVWKPRSVGDDLTNSHPSFVGSKIQQAFFHNNRLGFLSKDNVSMSQSQDFYNLYHTSAQTVTDADPVDISCSSIRPAALHGVIPTTQGLILFSKNQQFLMNAADGVLTPTTSNIRTISNYEMDTDVDPVDMGTNINFISKTPAYTRIFGMVTRGQDENPQVLDVGRVVNEWIPATIDTFIASPQNQFLVLSSQSDRKVYFYRTYNDGEKNLVEAWFNWELPGTVQTVAVDSDDMFAVTKQGSQFTLSKASLSQSPSDAIIVNNDGSRINPCIDNYAAASSVAYKSVESLTITNEGTGYSSAPTVSIAGTTGNNPGTPGSGATATVTVSGGKITEFTITNGGSGYTNGAVATFSGGGGSNAAATVNVFNGTKAYIPYTNEATLNPVLIIKGTTATGQFIESGFTINPERKTDGVGTYFKVPAKNLTSVASDVIVGWRYNLDIILPKTYVRTDADQKLSDFTASLIVARMKFAVGLSGVMGFKLKSTGTRQGEKRYTGYDLDPLPPAVVGDLNWVEEEISYIDRDQIKVRVNNNEITAFTFQNDTTINITSVPQQVFNNTGSGGAHTFTWTFDRTDMSKIVVQKETSSGSGVYTTQTLNTDYKISGEAEDKTIVFINTSGVPTAVPQNVKVRIYSADEIVIYLDEWYNLSPTQIADTYLANDIALSEQSVFSLPIHQKATNFQLRIFNDSPFPVSLNSMMWEGNYSPRFYKRF